MHSAQGLLQTGQPGWSKSEEPDRECCDVLFISAIFLDTGTNMYFTSQGSSNSYSNQNRKILHRSLYIK